MNCTICGKKITLVPSAEERAKATGMSASYFRGLFTVHSDCQVKEREAQVLELLRRSRMNADRAVANLTSVTRTFRMKLPGGGK